MSSLKLAFAHRHFAVELWRSTEETFRQKEREHRSVMMQDRRRLVRYAWLSIATAVVTIALKAGAYLLTDSVGLLSDALESSVNLVAALVALITLTIAALPPDDDHAYGHAKAEYFSSGVEGSLILVAAATIIVSAIRRLVEPAPPEQLGLGIVISVVAALCNLLVARVLQQAGSQYDSVTLTADAQHLMTDVWTSGGVIVGMGAVAATGWNILDPLIALAVAAQIVLAGIRLVKSSVLGLMDTALPAHELARLEGVLERYQRTENIWYHALRSRQSGSIRFVSVHIQVPGAWTVQRGHTLLENIELDMRKELGSLSVLTHLEPVEDPASWRDIPLNRDES
jgi:cation diffusion facilitator family transporter